MVGASKYRDHSTIFVTYLVSRVIVAIAIWFSMLEAADDSLRGATDPNYAPRGMSPNLVLELRKAVVDFDGIDYLSIIEHGYPSAVPPRITYLDPGATISFFPGFPAVIRAVDWFLPGSPMVAACLVNFILGFVAALLVYRLGSRWFDTQVGLVAATLFVFLPGSFVLSWAYSEALFICLCASSLLALDRQRWLTAGAWASLATFTRPNGVAIAIACLAAFVIDWRTNRRFNALVAVVLAPMGSVAYMAYLAVHTGEPGIWFRSQREAWDESYSWGGSTLSAIWNVARFRIDPNQLWGTLPGIFAVVALATVALGFFAARKYPLPTPALVYSVVIVFLMVITEVVIARPRFAFTAFPLVIPTAALMVRHPTARSIGFATSAALLGFVTASAAGLIVIP